MNINAEEASDQFLIDNWRTMTIVVEHQDPATAEGGMSYKAYWLQKPSVYVGGNTQAVAVGYLVENMEAREAAVKADPGSGVE